VVGSVSRRDQDQLHDAAAARAAWSYNRVIELEGGLTHLALRVSLPARWSASFHILSVRLRTPEADDLKFSVRRERARLNDLANRKPLLRVTFPGRQGGNDLRLQHTRRSNPLDQV